MQKRFLKWLPTLVTATLIFIESATPGKIVVQAGFGAESIHVTGHFLMFLTLGLCVWYATKSFSRAVVFTFLYALSDEYHQSFVPERAASWYDVKVDMLGALLGLFALWLWITFQKVLKKLKK